MYDKPEELSIRIDEMLDTIGSGRDVEIYLSARKRFSVSVYNDDVESIEESESIGMGVRVIDENREGYAYSTGFDTDIHELVASATANAATCDSDEGLRLPAMKASQSLTGTELGVFNPKLSQREPADKVKAALKLESMTLGRNKSVKRAETTSYSDSSWSYAVGNTNGVKGCANGTIAHCFTMAIADGESEQRTGYGFSIGHEMDDLDFESASNGAVERAVMQLGAKKADSRKVDLVIHPHAAADLLATLAGALNALSVLRKRSLFEGMTDERIASENFTLVDNGLLIGGIGTSPVDDEGMPAEETSLVDKGVLKGYLHNSYTAGIMQTVSTGNASRASYMSSPRVGPSNLLLKEGEKSSDEIIEAVGEGLYVIEFIGSHTGANPISGEISLGVVGLMIRNGDFAEPVKEVTVAGRMLDILKSIEHIGSDMTAVPKNGAIYVPTISVKGIQMAGI